MIFNLQSKLLGKTQKLTLQEEALAGTLHISYSGKQDSHVVADDICNLKKPKFSFNFEQYTHIFMAKGRSPLIGLGAAGQNMYISAIF